VLTGAQTRAKEGSVTTHATVPEKGVTKLSDGGEAWNATDTSTATTGENVVVSIGCNWLVGVGGEHMASRVELILQEVP
jgi:hypothetical protein